MLTISVINDAFSWSMCDGHVDVAWDRKLVALLGLILETPISKGTGGVGWRRWLVMHHSAK